MFSFSGILQPHIHYLLVLATSVDVVILGLSFPKGQAGKSFLQLSHNDLQLNCPLKHLVLQMAEGNILLEIVFFKLT